MFDTDNLVLPSVLQGITTTTESLELTMADEMRLGSLLRTLVASRGDAPVLQLGAGSGVLTAWLLDGMSAGGTLDAVEPDPNLAEVAGRFLGHDGRLRIHVNTPGAFLAGATHTYGLSVAGLPELDASVLEQVLDALDEGGICVFKGLAEEDGWSSGQQNAAGQIGALLQLRTDLHVTALNWASGLLIATKRELGGSE